MVRGDIDPPGKALNSFLLPKCEKDFSNLTLSDKEQRELYQAAQIIQKAYRSYKGRKKVSPGDRSSSSGAGLSDLESDQNKEAKAAIVIQNYYRRYKQVSRGQTFPSIHSLLISTFLFL